MRRYWAPCRVCGAEHTNPMSSSICSTCGAEERDARERAERLAHQAEDEKWRYLPASYRAMDDLERAIGSEQAEKVKSLIDAMIAERHE